MAFKYQAVDAAGKTVTDTVNADSPSQAAELLRERGMFVTQLEPVGDGTTDAPQVGTNKAKAGGRPRDVLFFTQQMSMLVRAGARVVEALNAVEEQTVRAQWRAVVQAVRQEVEDGRPLSAALGRFPRLFTGVYTNMIAAGEASGDVGLAFDRLAALTRQQQEIKNRVVGAMTYPAVLSLLCVGVIIALFSFVLPRFAEMFETLEVPLPGTTAILIAASNFARTRWPFVLVAVLAVAVSVFLFLRSPAGHRFVSRMSVRVPLFGVLVRNILLARICRIWGQLLDSKVSVLDAIQLTRESINNLDFQELLAAVEQAITEGSSIGPSLKRSWLLPRTFAAAIVTGEDSGKLSDSLLFVASCLEDENAQVLASLTRLIEPIMLTVMGVVVGVVAISLFLPMFDMATIAGK